jgi:hypothetical protein
MARAVLAHSLPIATAVLAGSKSLDEAYNEVACARRHCGHAVDADRLRPNRR